MNFPEIDKLVEEARPPKASVTTQVTRTEKQRLDALCKVAGVDRSKVLAIVVRKAIDHLQGIVDAEEGA